VRFDTTDGRLQLAGRVTRDPIRTWLATEEGAAAVKTAAGQIRFSLFGRGRAARRHINRVVWQAISAPAVREAIAAECRGYLAAWTPLAYAPSLPRVSIEYRRMVVVPRVMIVWRIASRITARLTAAFQAAGVPEGFCTFFAQWSVARMDEAVRSARPSPERPMHAEESWACVALDADMVWVDTASSGPDWQGHVVLFEMPSPRLARRQQRALQSTIGDLLASLPNLSRQQRDRTVRVAIDQLASVRA
jgi:hypothetical protein